MRGVAVSHLNVSCVETGGDQAEIAEAEQCT